MLSLILSWAECPQYPSHDEHNDKYTLIIGRGQGVEMIKNSYVIAQLGARRHYAIPRILHANGLLAKFHTDICSDKGVGRISRYIPLRLQNHALRRLADRQIGTIPLNLITTYDALGFRYRLSQLFASSDSDAVLKQLRIAREFCEKVILSGFEAATGVYLFIGTGLEVAERARSNGLRVVLDQFCAPPDFEYNLMRREVEVFKGWEQLPEWNRSLEAIVIRQRAEWKLADNIICGSSFVREAVASTGGEDTRCQVVPYGVSWPNAICERAPRGRRLRVLFVGDVRLQKGVQYIVEIARKVKDLAIVRLVGPVKLTEQIVSKISSDVEIVGPVPRSDVARHYAWADVFLFPSLCEGSAAVTYEALVNGLPVICTPNAGSIVKDGFNGFVVPIRDVSLTVERIRQLADDRNLLCAMKENVLASRESLTIEAYGERLVRVLNGGGG